MIVPEAEFMIMEDRRGNLYFHSQMVDLDKKSLSIPIELEGGMGTMEFKRSVAIIHPPNGKRKIIPVKHFKEMMDTGMDDFNLT